MNTITAFSEIERPESLEIEHLHRIINSLAKDVSITEMATIVAQECQVSFGANAVCIYVLRPDNVFQLVELKGCTEEFRKNFREIPRDKIGCENEDLDFFLGTPEELKKLLPFASKQIQLSEQNYFCFAYLKVENNCVGFIAFSYDNKPAAALDRHFISTFINLSAQALERTRLSELQNFSRTEADSGNRAKTDFLANINHEIRTPLGLIQGYMDLFSAAPGLTAEQKRWASVVRKNTKELALIIGDVLDYTKIEAEVFELEECPTKLYDLIEDVRLTAETKARHKQLQIEFQTGLLPTVIQTDPMRLRQILLNLISNAIKFTNEGKVSVTVKYREAGLIDFFVEDTGIGIADESLPKLFQPFMQVETSSHRRFGGTGLGLAISQRYARAMGGSLTLTHSEVGKGSTFCLTIPSGSSDLSIHKKNRVKKRQLEGLRVLVVDDSADNLELISYILNNEGAQVTTAESGEQAIRRALAYNYHVIVMDIQMPGIDGHETVTKLRKSGYMRPIAALTAHALSSEKRRSLQNGFDDYLTKPIDKEELISCLKRLHAKSRAH